MQKIVPFLWFDTQAEEAAKFYASLFDNSKIVAKAYYGDSGPAPKGTVLTVSFQLEGQTFTALNGGPSIRFTPAISLFVTCRTEQEVDALWRNLSQNGMVLMELQKYPFSEKFGWVQDRYGVSWQLNLTGGAKKITPFLMFVGKQHGKTEEAITYYVSLLGSSRIEQVERYGPGQGEPEGTVMHARFSLCGQEFMAMDSSREHDFTFTPGISFYINCDTQKEIDELWDKISEGGEKEQCGWVRDKYGVSWQIVPSTLAAMITDKDPARSNKVMAAILKMEKLDIKTLQKAFGR
jgi:predicted 3-demethylubiquinone-9 3-methyltransferase (glyoxalase superfamily)